jgi:hypothetical protein
MRVSGLLVVALAIHALSGCAQMVAQTAMADAREKFAKCAADNKSSPEGQMIAARLWQGNATDTAAKLSDPKPLTPTERNAFVQVHNRNVQCRQILLAYDNRYTAWETPYAQDFYQRNDQIFYKLASGELPVGVANKLYIESNGQFQADLSRGHAEAVRAEEAQQQQAAQALLQASIAAQAQNRTTTTNCSWFGNTLNCTSMR